MSSSEVTPGLGLSYATDAVLDPNEIEQANSLARRKSVIAALAAAGIASVLGAIIVLILFL